MQNRLFYGTNKALGMFCILAALVAGCEFDTEIDGPTSEISISPSEVFLEARLTNLVTFAASGGESNYTWTMNNSSIGTLLVSPTNSAIATYQNTTNTGYTVLTVRDSANNTANARITQR